MTGVELKGLKVLKGINNPILPQGKESTSIEKIEMLPIEHVIAGKYQPRTTIDDSKLHELANSIKETGIIQPIIVRKMDSAQYEIIAGERRWRASKIAGLSQLPVIVRKITDEVAMVMALIENIQREELNLIDRARALAQLTKEFAMTQEKISQTLGIPRTTISNFIRLLNLEEEVQNLIKEEKLDFGHAKILLTLEKDKQTSFAKKIVECNMSVRELERIVYNKKETKEDLIDSEIKLQINQFIKILENKLLRRITIKMNNKGSGKVMISVKSLADLKKLIELIE